MWWPHRYGRKRPLQFEARRRCLRGSTSIQRTTDGECRPPMIGSGACQLKKPVTTQPATTGLRIEPICPVVFMLALRTSVRRQGGSPEVSFTSNFPASRANPFQSPPPANYPPSLFNHFRAPWPNPRHPACYPEIEKTPLASAPPPRVGCNALKLGSTSRTGFVPQLSKAVDRPTKTLPQIGFVPSLYAPPQLASF